MLTAEIVLNKQYTPKVAIRLNKGYKLLSTATKGNPCYKHDMSNEIGLKGERAGRMYISAISYIRPVIANSKNKGYRLFNANTATKEDAEDAQHTLKELLSRCEELGYKTIALFKELDKYGLEYKKQHKAMVEFLEAMKFPKVPQIKIKEKII